MLSLKGRLVAIGLAAAAVAPFAVAPASATLTRRVIIPSARRHPAAHAQALRDPLYTRDPWGQPIPANCHWTRLQVPTSQGLRWVDEEHCNPHGW
jgi:hypothetical protein